MAGATGAPRGNSILSTLQAAEMIDSKPALPAGTSSSAWSHSVAVANL